MYASGVDDAVRWQQSSGDHMQGSLDGTNWFNVGSSLNAAGKVERHVLGRFLKAR
jgi:hypothetical protein